MEGTVGVTGCVGMSMVIRYKCVTEDNKLI